MIGDSTFSYWKDIHRDMIPNRVYNASLRAATTKTLVDHADELVIKFKPKTIVYLCGLNDLWNGLTVQEVAENFQ